MTDESKDNVFRWALTLFVGLSGTLATALWIMVHAQIVNATEEISSLRKNLYELRADIMVLAEQQRSLASRLDGGAGDAHGHSSR
ncbi:MAG TPA: hypothetical protein VFF88_01760 [Methylocella sp.]|nr:hypothetical protein [Methylocella sp.]